MSRREFRPQIILSLMYVLSPFRPHLRVIDFNVNQRRESFRRYSILLLLATKGSAAAIATNFYLLGRKFYEMAEDKQLLDSQEGDYIQVTKVT